MMTSGAKAIGEQESRGSQYIGCNDIAAYITNMWEMATALAGGQGLLHRQNRNEWPD